MRVGAKALGRDIVACRRRRRRSGILAQGDAQRLLQPYRGRKRERATAAQHLLQRRKAELGLLGQRLAGDAALGELLTNFLRDLAALLVGKLLVRRLHRDSLLHPDILAGRTNQHKTARARLRGGVAGWPAAEHCRSFCSRNQALTAELEADPTCLLEQAR